MESYKKNNVLANDLIRSLPGHVYWMDNQGVILGCNDLQAWDLGFSSADDLVGKHIHDVCDKECVGQILANNKEVMLAKKMLVFEESYVHDGERRIMLSNKSPLYENGKIIGVIGVSLDVVKELNLRDELQQQVAKANVLVEKLQDAEKRNMELMTQLKEKITGEHSDDREPFFKQVLDIKNYLEKIIAIIPGNIYWLDRNNVYLGCNDANAKFAGVKDRYSIVGKKNIDLAWKKRADFLDKINNQVMESGVASITEETGMTADGKRTYLSTKAPLRDSAGKIIGLVGTSIDITEKKNLEEDLRKEKERAEAASLAKSEFILNMEHDVRTPLAHMVSFSDVIANTDLDVKTMREYAGYLYSSSKQLLSLFNEILMVIDVEAGNMPLGHKLVNLQKIITDIRELQLIAVKTKGVELLVDIKEPLLEFKSDLMRIQRILLNLVGNAIRYTEKGYIKIHASLNKIDEEHGELKLVVEDSGIGIPQDKLQVIFDKFVRLTPSNTNQYKGLGLGLWIVRQFVNDLRGEIVIESKLGRGSKFILTFPVIL